MSGIKSVKGTRDFYPDDMRLRNWIADTWREVSLRNGFEEYDAPIFEYLDLFTIKSGDEIAEQLFSFTDRGGRNLAIRPEITPSLARMVNAKVNTLPRPIKWFSVPRLCRAENPQKGRLREFFQWNVDVIGADDVLADAECIYTAVDFLREVGLTPEDVVVRIGSRPLVVDKLRQLGVDDASLDKALTALDRRPKVVPEAFEKQCADAGLAADQIAAICEFLDVPETDMLKQLSEMEGVDAHRDDLLELRSHLEAMGVWAYCRFDWHIVRGLAYYTGIVYEVFAADAQLRAVAGGGRYDNLLEVLGGPQVGATGFGMGDVVLGILLAEKGKLPDSLAAADYFVIDGDGCEMSQLLKVVGELRKRGVSAEFSYKRANTGKQLKDANKRGAKAAVIVRGAGEPVGVKNLTSGHQAEQSLDEFLSLLDKAL